MVKLKVKNSRDERIDNADPIYDKGILDETQAQQRKHALSRQVEFPVV